MQNETKKEGTGNGCSVSLVVMLAVSAVLTLGVIVPTIGAMRPRSQIERMKCGTQLRGIQQAMVVWASSNGNTINAALTAPQAVEEKGAP